MIGCSTGPDAIEPVAIDASAAGREAIAMLDRDGDRLLSEVEMALAPGLHLHREKYDRNGDAQVSADEIRDRIEQWEDEGLGIRRLKVYVKLDDKPLPDATVRFLPEPYLGSGPKPATGKTNASGLATISVAPEDLPASLANTRIRGIYGGTYRIEVSHPTRSLPARYHAETTLGAEIARDTLGDQVELELKSRE